MTDVKFVNKVISGQMQFVKISLFLIIQHQSKMALTLQWRHMSVMVSHNIGS